MCFDEFCTTVRSSDGWSPFKPLKAEQIVQIPHRPVVHLACGKMVNICGRKSAGVGCSVVGAGRRRVLHLSDEPFCVWLLQFSVVIMLGRKQASKKKLPATSPMMGRHPVQRFGRLDVSRFPA